MLRNECFVQGLSKVSSFKARQSLTGTDETGDKMVLKWYNGPPTHPLKGI